MDVDNLQLSRKRRPEDEDLSNRFSLSKRIKETGDGLLRPAGYLPAVHKRYTYADYLVGWICALPLEMRAARSMLDEEHPLLPIPSNDPNTYILGSMSGHNIVMACLPAGVYGLNAATVVAVFMTSTFPNSSTMPLLVGIGGGVPSAKHDVRLGDIVVSMPTSDNHAIVQHDRGKMIGTSLIDPRGTVNKPANILLSAVAALQSRQHLTPEHVSQNIALAISRHSLDDFKDPGEKHDILHQPGCRHCKEGPACENCEPELVERTQRVTRYPEVHYGMIGSGNQVIKHAAARDRIATQHGGILCFEMEAAGVMDYAPCLVIRGICDYADEHKKKHFQGYAAMTAAAFAKELLTSMPLRTSVILPTNQSPNTPLDLKDSMKLLDFAESDYRRDTVKNAHGRTCEWVLKIPEYLQWVDLTKMKRHHGLLWIKGKPGTGKSTIMKFILQHFENAVEDGKDMTIISFFLNARGDKLERSTIGLYRSLIYQLLEKIPSSFDVLRKVTREEFVSSINRVGYLQMIFRRIIVRLKDVNILCIIDALDECPEDEIQDLVEFFEDLSRVSSLCKFQILFSSRHYPNITIGIGIKLILEDEQGHDQDIIDYVDSRLLVGSSAQVTELKSEVFRKSNGIFLWVVLVVRILCREYGRGRLHKLSQILQEIPEDLNDLLSEILLRDNRNLPELILCMQWLLYSRRPLGREELYYGLLAVPGTQQLWSTEEVTVTVMDNYILDCSKGLVEITKSKEPIVQFIHESVRELLLVVNLSAELKACLYGLDEETGNMHIAKCCTRYLCAVDLRKIGTSSSSSENKKDDDQVDDEYHEVQNYLNYSDSDSDTIEDVNSDINQAIRSHTPDDVRNDIQDDNQNDVKAHKNTNDSNNDNENNNEIKADSDTSSCSSESEDDILKREQKSWRAHMREVSSAWQPDDESDNGNKIRNDSNNINWTPLRHSSWYRFPLLEYAIKFVLKHIVCAARAGQRDAVLPEGLDLEQWLSYYQLLCDEPKADIQMTLARHDLPELIKSVVRRKPAVEINDVVTSFRRLAKRNHHEACWAVYQGVRQLAELSNKERIEFDSLYELLQVISKDRDLWYAYQDMRVEPRSEVDANLSLFSPGLRPSSAIKSLTNIMLQTSATCCSPEDLGIALHAAALSKKPSAVQILLEKGATNSVSIFVLAAGRPSAYNATSSIMSDTIDCLEILKPQNQDVNATNHRGEAAIHAASVWASSDVIRYLINSGADVNLKNSRDGWTPLSYAGVYSNLTAARALLDAGAAVDIAANSGPTPIHLAANPGPTPMHLAIANGDPDFVNVLSHGKLENRSTEDTSLPAQLILTSLRTFNSRLNQFFRNSKLSICSWLCCSLVEDGRLRTVEALLDSGAATGIQTGCHHVPLHRAVSCGRVDMLELLLKYGADVNEQDQGGTTALHEAARHSGMDGVLKVLLEQRDVDITLKDNEGNTALHEAGINGKDLMVRKLVERGADIHSENNRHRTPFQEAAFGSSRFTAKVLRKLGSRVVLPLRDDDDTDGDWEYGSRWINAQQD